MDTEYRVEVIVIVVVVAEEVACWPHTTNTIITSTMYSVFDDFSSLDYGIQSILENDNIRVDKIFDNLVNHLLELKIPDAIRDINFDKMNLYQGTIHWCRTE